MKTWFELGFCVVFSLFPLFRACFWGVFCIVFLGVFAPHKPLCQASHS
nr:MAG TPA: hypothetical protein [Caudoviricetes sp.]